MRGGDEQRSITVVGLAVMLLIKIPEPLLVAAAGAAGLGDLDSDRKGRLKGPSGREELVLSRVPGQRLFHARDVSEYLFLQ